MSTNVGPANDPYLSSYYGPSIPYQLEHGAWSSGPGAANEVPFLGGYPQQQQQHQHQHHDSYGIDVFGPNGGFGSFGNYDYSSTWDRKAAQYDDYYAGQNRSEYSPRDEPVKQVEQSMQGLSIDQKQEQSAQPKKLTWASIASQPAKPQLTTKKKSMVPPPMVTPRTPSLDIGTWENKNGPPSAQATPPPEPMYAVRSDYVTDCNETCVDRVKNEAKPVQAPMKSAPYQEPVNLPPRPSRPSPPPVQAAPIRETVVISPPKAAPVSPAPPANALPVVVEDLQLKHNYNPKEFDLSAKNARFFVIKSYSEDDIHRSIKYEIWCSTEHGNKRLDAAFRERYFYF